MEKNQYKRILEFDEGNDEDDLDFEYFMKHWPEFKKGLDNIYEKRKRQKMVA
jgi:hypothetical protein